MAGGPARWSDIERGLRRAGGPLIAGVDEVGRGSLAGPVVACAIIMPPADRAIRGVDDSKVLSAKERARLDAIIRARSLAFALGAASAHEIDRINIYYATALAMRRALRRLAMAPDHVLVWPDLKDAFVCSIGQAIKEFYGDDPKLSPDYGRIVNRKSSDRLAGLLASGKAAVGGQTDANER